VTSVRHFFNIDHRVHDQDIRSSVLPFSWTTRQDLQDTYPLCILSDSGFVTFRSEIRKQFPDSF
jgi:hypothetical protein